MGYLAFPGSEVWGCGRIDGRSPESGYWRRSHTNLNFIFMDILRDGDEFSDRGAKRRVSDWESRPELKAVEISFATYQPNSGNVVVTPVNLVAAGTDLTNRIGRKILMQSLEGRCFIAPTDATTNASITRVVVVYDKQIKGALPTGPDIFSEPAVGSCLSPYNLNNRDRFVVLYDNVVPTGGNLGSAAIALGSPSVAYFQFRIDVSLPTLYDGTGGVIGDITYGGLFVVCCNSEPGGAGSDVRATYRLRFTES